jgi:hypothetical protein
MRLLGLILFSITGLACELAGCGESFLELAKRERLDPLAGKVESRLLSSIHALNDGAISNSAATRGVASSLEKRLSSAPVGRLPLTLDVPRVNDQILEAIAASGAQVSGSSVRWNTVNVVASLEEIEALMRLPGVRSIKTARRPQSRQSGMATNQADGSMKADLIRTAYGLTGAGQKVGVLSDSCNQTPIGPGTITGTAPNALLSGMKNQLSGDLPAQIQVIDFGPIDPPNKDEGSALMELIHDVAPGAEIAFASAYTSHTEYANDIIKLRQAGCTVICDDAFYYEEPMYQDGPIAQAITSNFEAGVPHISSAGNEANFGIRTTYKAVNPGNPQNGGSFHDWDIAGQPAGYLPVDVPAGDDLVLVMQWAQPYQSFNLGPGSAQDFNLYMLDAPAANATVLAKSTEPQFVNNVPNGDPYEALEYINTTGATQRVYLAVDRAAGAGAPEFRIILFGDRRETYPFGGMGIEAMCIYGHTASAEALSIGGILFADIDSGGGWRFDFTAINADSFSSKGGIGAAGVPLYFDTAGHPLANAPQLRDKPDLAAPDGGNTTFFGQFAPLVINNVSYGDDNYPKFFGTSASAANAAAVVALLKERAPLSSPTQLKHALQSSALDIVASAPLSVVGPDDLTGAGLINAQAAANRLPSVVAPPADQTVLETTAATFSAAAAGPGTLTYQWRKNGAPIQGQTQTALTLTNVPFEDDGARIDCVVSSDDGALASFAAVLRVNPLPKITQQPLNAIAHPGASATFSVEAIRGPLIYQWRRNGMEIQGATAATYTLTAAGINDDGAQFDCVISNPFASVESSSATLTLDLNPVLVSGPTAAPQVAAAGTPIQFFAIAEGAFGQAVSLLWNFGDGNTADGGNVAHIFYVAGHYTVTLRVTDAAGLTISAALDELIYNDADADGIVDLVPTLDNSLYPETIQRLRGLVPTPLVIQSLQIGLNFTTTQSDKLTLTGTLPVPAGFSTLNHSVTVILGGLGRTFILDAKGNGTAVPNGAFALKLRRNSPSASFKLALKGAALQQFFADEGFVNKNANNEVHSLRVTIFFNGLMYDAARSTLYTATKNRSGRAK